MQLFMWQGDIANVGVAYVYTHPIIGCFDVLGALDDAPDGASASTSSALAAGSVLILSANWPNWATSD